MIFIGDLSKADVEVLKRAAQVSERILEFGVGGSTQIFRSFSDGEVVSLETDPDWIKRTRENLVHLGIEGEVDFRDYYTFTPDGVYDLIFSDGADEFRLDFALNHWNNLKVGGALIFHDTRRSRDIGNVAEFVKQKSSEILNIYINMDNSNMTVIIKREALLYENWNEVEQKSGWESGYEPINLDELKKKYEQQDKL